MQKRKIVPKDGYILVELLQNNKTSTGILINSQDHYREAEVVKESYKSIHTEGELVIIPLNGGIPIDNYLLIKEEEVMATYEKE